VISQTQTCGLKLTPFRVFLGLSEAWLRAGSSRNLAAGDAPWTPHRCNQQCHRCALSRESCIQLEQNRPILSKTASVQVGTDLFGQTKTLKGVGLRPVLSGMWLEMG
jgi:hypothetical protein